MTTRWRTERPAAVRLGLRENAAQFTLLVVINAFVGAMVGMERSILPPLAEQEFHLVARTRRALIHRRLRSDEGGHELCRRAPGRSRRTQTRARRGMAGRGTGSVHADVGAELELDPRGQRAARHQSGLHLVDDGDHENRSGGRARRGLAMGLNEFAGYVAVAGAALLTGWIAARTGLRPEPFYPGDSVRGAGLGSLAHSSCARPRRTSRWSRSSSSRPHGTIQPRGGVFWRTTWTDRNLSTISQAGLVNNLNDGMAWGLFPLFFAAANMGLDANRHPRRHLSGDVGRRPTRDRSAFGSRRTEVADRQRHVGAGGWDRRRDPVARLHRVRNRRSAARDRHGDGVSDAARRDRRRGAAVVARVGGRRLSPLAGSWLRASAHCWRVSPLTCSASRARCGWSRRSPCVRASSPPCVCARRSIEHRR